MAIDRFTGFGLGVAVLGWATLIGNALTPFAGEPGHVTALAGLRSEVVTLAEAAIFSGFALAIMGVLRAGFGALHRFFDAVLERANAPRPAPRATAAPSQPVAEPEPAPAVELAPARPSPRTVRGRNYTILDNGAVEVETLLGTRVFASLDEARDYIR